ncbi:MAG: EamA family transporter [Betaproteobacteria bacterium]
MNVLTAVLWISTVIVDTVGHMVFKKATIDTLEGHGLAYWLHMARRPWLWLGISCYVLEFLLWLAFLSLVPLSKGVLLGSINIVAISIAGRLIFSEKMTPLRVAGISLIAVGVAVVGIS